MVIGGCQLDLIGTQVCGHSIGGYIAETLRGLTED